MRYWLLSIGVSCLLVAVQVQASLPSFTDIKQGFHSSYAELHDRHGQFLHAQRLNKQVNRLHWVSLADISPALQEAVIFTEDREFYSHRGVDWSATAFAAVKYLSGDKSRGASTISMQLSGLINTELAWRKGGRSLTQKWNQMSAARELERHWSKAEILEAYLNLVTWRGDLQGIAAASHALFSKSPQGLDRNEGLLLAALLASPNASPARSADRACAQMAAGFQGSDCGKIKQLAQQALSKRQSPYAERPALEALAARLLQQANRTVQTSLDAALQKKAEDLLVAHLLELRGHHVNAGAALVLDNSSGEVLAYVANAGLVESARHVDAIQAWRQAGSTLKPFMYEQAIERKYLTAASVLEDSPISLPTPNGLYTPQNYDGDFKGPVSVRTALASSLNVPAVRVLNLIGVDEAWQRLRDLGLKSLNEDPDFYGYSLALGSADVTLWSLANAYRSLANRGEYSSIGFEKGRQVASQSIMNPDASFIIADILSDRSARSTTFGFENSLATPFWTAVKTGTSKDMRDNWCVGFSRRYTVAVWVGNLDGSPMHDVSGVSGAAPLWAAMMKELEGGQVRPQGDAPPAPLSLERHRVQFKGLNEPPRDEWFMANTALEEVVFMPQIAARIIYPANETIIAIDPDIPAAQQRIRFRAENPSKKSTWWLNGRLLSTDKEVDWQPVAGQHRLVLKDAQGRVQDAVLFTVRGSATKP